MPEVLRPLYESSKVVAQKMTIAVSRLYFHWIGNISHNMILRLDILYAPVLVFYGYGRHKDQKYNISDSLRPVCRQEMFLFVTLAPKLFL